MTNKEIRTKVDEFRKEYNLEEVNLDSLSSVIEKLGYTLVKFSSIKNDEDIDSLIKALGLEDHIKNQRGFTYADSESRIVFVNEALSEKEQLIVLSHELGHIVLGHFHKSNFIGNDVTDEYEANEFSHHLISPSPLRKIIFFISMHKLPYIIGGGIVLAAAAVAIVLTIQNSNSHITYDEPNSDESKMIIASNEVTSEESSADPSDEESTEIGTNANGETVVIYKTASGGSSSSSSGGGSSTTAAETTTASHIQEPEYGYLDSVAGYRTPEQRYQVVDTLLNYYGDTSIYSSVSHNDTSDGGAIYAYLSGDAPSSNYSSAFSGLVKVTKGANHWALNNNSAFSAYSNYYAYVYNGSGSLICTILNGSVY